MNNNLAVKSVMLSTMTFFSCHFVWCNFFAKNSYVGLPLNADYLKKSSGHQFFLFRFEIKH